MSEFSGFIPREELTKSNDTTKDKENYFVGSEFMRMKKEQEAVGMPFTIIHTDIDNTFFRGDRSDNSTLLACVAYESHVPIHAVTGNSVDVVIERITKGELPYFPVISGKVGTERYILHIDSEGKKNYVRDEYYDQRMKETGYDRYAIAMQTQDIITTLNNSQNKDSHVDWQLQFQQPENERLFLQRSKDSEQPYKVSCCFFAQSLEEMLKLRESIQLQFSNQKVVICEEINYNSNLSPGDTRKKYCLDILPITKADAVNQLVEQIGSDINIVAGDSGNDIDMLTGSGDVSVSVGGSKPELIQVIEEATYDQESNKIRQFPGSFNRVNNQGKQKLYYREINEHPFTQDDTRLNKLMQRLSEKASQRLGPDSIIRTLRILTRAAMIYKEKITATYGKQDQQVLRGIYDKLGSKTIDDEVYRRIYTIPSTT
jgi:hydroxymethylpyrimidine pyrophosphatase-like HAD family hydrolase